MININRRKIEVLLAVLLSLCLTSSPSLSEELNTDPFKPKEKEEEVSFSDLFRSRSNEAYTGVILANFIYIDPKERFIYVKPHEDNLPKLTVYIDKRTLFSTMKVGNIGKGKKSMMLEGDRVAIRAMIKHGLILADEIFMVDGEFGPKARFAKRKYAAPKPGGGGEKKPQKKSGGGH